ncbi:MAG: hypothetical protein WA864_32120 [Acetobacteraceae bacterium]|jgi:hypothetical protein
MPHTPLATLRFYAADLAPSIISKIIPEKPTRIAGKGAVIAQLPGGRRGRARVGTWFITTKNKYLGDLPDQHLEWVVRLAQNHLQAIRAHVPDVRVDLSLLVHDAGFNVTSLPRELLRHAVDIGELEIEIPERGEDIFLTSDNLAQHLAASGQHGHSHRGAPS